MREYISKQIKNPYFKGVLGFTATMIPGTFPLIIAYGLYTNRKKILQKEFPLNELKPVIISQEAPKSKFEFLLTNNFQEPLFQQNN